MDVRHQKHHKNTGNIDRDEVFMPIRKKFQNIFYLQDYRNLANIYFGFGAAWFLYLLFGYTPNNRFLYHFWPYHSVFYSHKKEILGSHFFYALSLMALSIWIQKAGFFYVLMMYGIPLTIFAFWIVLTTFLHHNERNSVHWFSGNKWTYVKGNLSSFDRFKFGKKKN